MIVAYQSKLEVRESLGLMTQEHVAALLGQKLTVFRHAMYNGHFAAPTHQIGKGRRCYYSQDDLVEIKKYFDTK